MPPFGKRPTAAAAAGPGAGPPGSPAAGRANPDMSWLYRAQETLEREYMASRAMPPELAQRVRPYLACIFCHFHQRETYATTWVPLSPAYPDPAAPSCDQCWSQAFYVLLARDTNIYQL